MNREKASNRIQVFTFEIRTETVCPLLVIFHHFGDFGLSDGDQMVRENNGDFGVIFVFLGNFKKNYLSCSNLRLRF